MKNIWIFISLSCLLACGSEKARPADIVVEEDKTLPSDLAALRSLDPEMAKWICLPGERVGLIKPNFTEEDLHMAYGEENVTRQEISGRDMSAIPASFIFEGEKDEICVLWKQDAPYQVIEEILITHAEGNWQTPQGVRIGTTLEELERINTEPFYFYGFEWEYAGLVNDWNGGKFPNTFQVTLEADNPEAVYPDLLGDKKFLSSTPEAEAAKLKVIGMTFTFLEPVPEEPVNVQ